MKISKEFRILIATFSPWKNGKRLPINGNLEPMIDFFKEKVKETVMIDQVYPGSDFLLPRIEVHKKGKKGKFIKPSLWLYPLLPFLKISNTDATHTAFKLRDFISVITVPKGKTPYDVFIGFEAINAIAGIVLRKFGKIKLVIYYVSDYSPKRYSNALFNSVYLWLDRYAAIHSDYVWDVSKAMHPARIKAGLGKTKCAPVLHVPNALYPSQIINSKSSEIIQNSLVFMGTLGRENGPDLAIEALPIVLKDVRGVTLHIVGGGREEELEKLATKLGISDRVIFHGFISDRLEVSQLISKFAIGLAPYIYNPTSARLYGDATKIRAYTASGLPVVTTQVPPLGSDIKEAGAGIVVKDNKNDLAKGIIALLKNKKEYEKLRSGAIEFAKNNTWENVYRKAFKEM